MRGVCALVLVTFSTGCATTVHRMDGDFPTAAGVARTECEKQDWLVVSPTRAEFVDKHGVKSESRDDGVALYRIGESRPVSIPSLSDDMGGGPSFARHSDAVRSHDTKQVVAGSLGAAGAIAVAVGTILFVSAFSTQKGANGDEEQKIDSGRAIGGGISVGLGFGLGIAGISVNPGQAERSRAEASRFVYFPPEEPKADVLEMTGRYNQAVRDRCERRSAP
ncbi:MAG TPA: hypothetical protein VHP33_07175 [Polyangiaceae bacterium]|nr:hypothetical protein [Polyangiaceae bacterium]